MTGIRIVWHYDAFSETRTFDVSYTFRGLTRVYDDVADVNLRVWGDEWDVEFETTLRRRVTCPGTGPRRTSSSGVTRRRSTAFTELKGDGSGATLAAANIPPGRWVEMRTVFPSDRLDESPADAQMEDRASGLPDILEEEKANIAAAERDRSRMRFVRQGLPWLIPLAIVPGADPRRPRHRSSSGDATGGSRPCRPSRSTSTNRPGRYRPRW